MYYVIKEVGEGTSWVCHTCQLQLSAEALSADLRNVSAAYEGEVPVRCDP